MVSLGPGDIDLVTIRALKALQQCDVIYIPTKSADGGFGRSLTHKIVVKLMEEHGFDKPLKSIYTPMKFRVEDWQRGADTLMEASRKYNHICFVTLGDAAVYSTVYYLLDIIARDDPDLYDHCEVIEGITSFSQASARIKKPLCVGDSRFEIVPLMEREVPSTKVYMRPKIDSTTKQIYKSGEFYTFENLNFSDERITQGKIEKVEKYMTLMIDFFDKGK